MRQAELSEASVTMSDIVSSGSTSSTDADVAESLERNVVSVSSREHKASVQRILMTCMAKLQDAFYETVVAVGDEIHLQAHEMGRGESTVHGNTRGTWTAQQWQSNWQMVEMSARQQGTARGATHGRRRGRDRVTSCAMAELLQRQDAWDADRARMTEQLAAVNREAKQELEQHIENLKELMTQSCRMVMARLSELEERAEECEAELQSQRESQVTALAKQLDPLAQLPERITHEILAEAPDAISSDAGIVQNIRCHNKGGGSA